MTDRQCQIEGCEVKWHARRLCNTHYNALSRRGALPNTLVGQPPRRLRDVLEEFRFIVDYDGGVRAPNTKIGWAKSTRAVVAERINMPVERLDRMLYRAIEKGVTI